MDTKECVSTLTNHNLSLLFIIETHTHADHISSGQEIKAQTGAKIIRSQNAPSKSADIYVVGGEKISLGDQVLEILYTPGHTNESISVYNGAEVFTGDTLLIGGTGRTDFQVGSSEDLYESIHHKIADLPHDTIVRPGHNYQGKNAVKLGDELHTNERITLCRDTFIHTLDSHHPPKPELFEESLYKNSL
jgi:glyoxylase-like metal-dependent hydrolase (beta-lactamase superfamily II)